MSGLLELLPVQRLPTARAFLSLVRSLFEVDEICVELEKSLELALCPGSASPCGPEDGVDGDAPQPSVQLTALHDAGRRNR